MRRFAAAVCLFLLSIRPGWAEDIDLGKINVENLQKIYDFYGYDEYLNVNTYRLPPIFLKEIPEDFHEIQDEARRNDLFIKIMAPLALKVNRAIAQERAEILPLYDSFIQKREPLSEKGKKFVEEKAEKYGLFTRLKDDERYTYFLRELYRRVDAVPPSLQIAVAAIETEWGTNRLVREGNALYKERVWHTDEGLKPVDDEDDYRYRIFPSLYAAMESFALKINSAIDFDNFRHLREEIRYRDNPVLGTSTAFALFLQTPLKNYAGLLNYTIAYYELNIIDKSELDAKITKKGLQKNLAVFLD